MPDIPDDENADRRGFGGGRVVALERALDHERPVIFFGVDRDLARRHGPPNDGAAVSLRERTARMAPWVLSAASRGYEPFDIGVLWHEDIEELADEVVRLGALLAMRRVRSVAVGCDHVVSYIHVLGRSAAERPIFIYLDAHLDLGAHDSEDIGLHNGSFVAALLRSGRVAEVINVGARAWTTWHPNSIVANVEIVRTTEQSETFERLERFAGRMVYVSIDADVLDPAISPGHCCPEPFGLLPRELLAICSFIGERCEVTGADVSELQADSGHTAEILMRCVHALFHNPRNTFRHEDTEHENAKYPETDPPGPSVNEP